MISLSKENPNRWYELAWWLCVITLPLPDTYNNACIILLSMVWLMDNRLFKDPVRLKRNWWAWPFFFYFLWMCVGLIYSPDEANGFFTIEKKISFWALPMIAITGRELSSEFFSFLKRSFVYSCLMIVVICLCASLYNYSAGNTTANFDFNSYENFLRLHPDGAHLWSSFSYIQLIQWAGLHPTYFSMYLVFCLIILISESYRSKMESRVHIGIGCLLGIFVALLSSRAAIIAFFFSVFYLVIDQIVKKKSPPVFSVLSISALLVLCLWINPISRFRLLEEPLKTSYSIDSSTTNWNSVSYRLLEWSGSWSIIQQNIFSGVGTGGWQKVMTDFYAHFNSSTVGLEHNAHNQYLQVWMENGLPGLLAFLVSLSISFFYVKPGAVHISFLLIFSIMCLTESIGERQKGIVFFTLFQVLFLTSESKNR
jgi:hypothetical protein